MADAVVLLGMLFGASVAFYLWLNARLRRLSRERLLANEMPAEAFVDAVPRQQHVLRRHWLLPWLVGLIFAAGLHYLVGLQEVYCAAGAIVVALIGSQIEKMIAQRNIQQMEMQLADAIDLMVGALRAGVSVSAALESALTESRWPLRPQLEEVVGRIRLGDEPQTVFKELAARIPLETFLLFSSALSVHWEVGGNLAPTLATVGRTIRDRIELSRRIRSMSAQSRVSTIAVLGTTYFIALVMWRSDPHRMADFLSTSMGSTLVAGAVFLQAFGIVWSEQMSRVKF